MSLGYLSKGCVKRGGKKREDFEYGRRNVKTLWFESLV